MAAHRRLYCGSFTSVTIIQPSGVLVGAWPARYLTRAAHRPPANVRRPCGRSSAAVDWQRLTSIQRPVAEPLRARTTWWRWPGSVDAGDDVGDEPWADPMWRCRQLLDVDRSPDRKRLRHRIRARASSKGPLCPNALTER